MIIKFWVPKYGENESDAVEFESLYTDCRKDFHFLIAEKVAEYYYYDCDGCESVWPLTFEIVADGVNIGRWEVGREIKIDFSAGRVE